MTHPEEHDLALLAGGEASRVRSFFVDRHLRRCSGCQEKVAGYQELRAQLAELEMPEPNWSSIAPEMQANIRLGLEAGACVRARSLRSWSPRIAIGLASLLVVAGAGFLMRNIPLPHRPSAPESAAAVLRLTGDGVELRTGRSTLMLLSHHRAPADQTVNARGEMGARYIDGETGSVTITNAYLPQ